MALTKSVAQVDEWVAVAQNTVVEGATADISANYQTLLTIMVALTSETAAANGCEIAVQISAATSGDEDWVDLTRFQGPIGTANKEDSTANPLAAGATTITCASTTGYTKPTSTDNGLRYLKDATIANSEVVLQNGLTTNTNITIVDGTTNEHANTMDMYNIVGAYVIQIPDAANRLRVIYNNTKDAAGSTCDVMSRISRITAI
jgi:hypothetical protein